MLIIQIFLHWSWSHIYPISSCVMDTSSGNPEYHRSHMRSKYTQMDCKQLEAPQLMSKAFGAPHAQATPVSLISVEVVLPNSNRPAVTLDMRNTKKWESHSIPMASNTQPCCQRVDIAMLSSAVRVLEASKSRCSDICSLKAVGARFNVAYAFYQLGDWARKYLKHIFTP